MKNGKTKIECQHKDEKEKTEFVFQMAEKYALQEIQVDARKILLREGEKAGRIYFVKTGCLRLWLNSNGKEITHQFFLEGSMVASLESILTNQPSDFYLETIEKSTLYFLEKEKFEALLDEDLAFKEWFNHYIMERFIYYSRHLSSFLKDKPEVRFEKLLENKPLILQRIPQHYIASYLGITPVSLSRIRNKLLKKEKMPYPENH